MCKTLMPWMCRNHSTFSLCPIFPIRWQEVWKDTFLHSAAKATKTRTLHAPICVHVFYWHRLLSPHCQAQTVYIIAASRGVFNWSLSICCSPAQCATSKYVPLLISSRVIPIGVVLLLFDHTNTVYQCSFNHSFQLSPPTMPRAVDTNVGLASAVFVRRLLYSNGHE